MAVHPVTYHFIPHCLPRLFWGGWTSRQVLAGLTDRDRQPHMLTFMPMGSLE